tara:strand:- start:234 stop:482 length:249 start_codon:yes stop_codon:yes gene_type:complete
MSATTLLPIGTSVYYKGGDRNNIPDVGWITEHRFDREVYCCVREEWVREPHYLVSWADGTAYYSTHKELLQEEFLILEDTCK